MNTRTIARLAMGAAGVMLAHQVASKAFRDAAFLTAWATEALPLMIAVAAVAVVAAVPLFARLLERFGSHVVVPAGFLVSAAGHVLEWQLSATRPWVAVVVYLHVAGLGALLLSGFWSVVSERFAPQGARANFGRIAAAGTIGGAVGGLSAALVPFDTVLLLLAALHVLSAIGVLALGRAPVLLPEPHPEARDRTFAWRVVRSSPNLRTIALIVVLTTAGATVLDYLLKWQVKEVLGTGPYLLRFLAIFYGLVQVGSFFAQAGAGGAVRRLGIGRTIATLPAGVGITSGLGLLFPGLIMLVGLRGVEALLRYSLFRSGYEMLFVPMDATERTRIKTFLDVTCDRAGEALGAGIVQLLLIVTAAIVGSSMVAPLTSELMVVLIALSAGSILLARRLDRLYLGVVEQQLARHAAMTPMIVGSETGWTRIDIPQEVVREITREPAPAKKVIVTAVRRDDARVQLLSELRSGDRRRVEAALAKLTDPDRMHVAQIVQLLAWDDLVGAARIALERAAPAHIGLLSDVLLDPSTDFAIRRRVPRILATIDSERALDALLRGLDDQRFEVRYQCGRAMERILSRNERLSVDRARVMAIVERELSVPEQVWQGHRLIDQPDREDDPAALESGGLTQRNFEHVFSLLSAVLPREPLQVALRGISSPNPGLRGLALEYLESVLPPPILARLWQLVDVPAEEMPHLSPERALEQLRLSTETPTLRSSVNQSRAD